MGSLTSEEDVFKLAKKLDKMSKAETVDAAAVMEQIRLLKTFKMTIDVLQRTRIGVIINAVRKKTSDQECSQVARGLIKSWKKLLPTDGGDNEEEGAQETNTDTNAGGQDSDRRSSTSEKQNGSKTTASSFSKKEVSSASSSQGDPTRSRCSNLILDALRFGAAEDTKNGTGVETDDDKLSTLALDLEEAIFADIRKTDDRYKNRIRSRVMNLRDKKNQQLRNAYIEGAVSPDQLAKMTPEEMASDELKALREKFTKEAITENQMAFSGGTTTTQIKCTKCGKSNCTYNQVQTRSADEPMTTFVLCNECGRRWKFC